MDDEELARRIVAKYPQYKDSVEFGQESAAVPEENIANAGNTKPEVSFGRKAERILLPATAEQFHDKGGAGGGLGMAGAVLKDVVSAPRRMFGAGMELLKGNGKAARIEMESTGGQGIVNEIAREAPLMLTPGGLVRGASKARRIGSALLAGAKESIPSAIVHQAENASTGEGASAADFVGEVATGGLLRGSFQGAGEVKRAGKMLLKQGASAFSEVPGEVLEDAAAPGALEKFRAAARKYGTKSGTDLTSMAEDLGQRVDKENAARTASVQGARRIQLENFEGDLMGLRRDVTGGKAKRIGEIRPGAQGDQIQTTLKEAKGPLQTRYTEGDRAAYGGLRDAPAPSREVRRIETSQAPMTFTDENGGFVEAMVPGSREVTERIPLIVDEIDNVLSDFKALDASQGVPKISGGAQRAIQSIRGLAGRVRTVDDLVDLKAHIRGIQATGGFEGAVFDKTRDDLALGKVLDKVFQEERAAIQAAAPKKAAKIIQMVDANNALYGKNLEALRKTESRLGTAKTQGVISKVRDMDVKEARELMQELQSNEVLGPVAHELRNGFVDDLLTSAVKDGQVSPKAFAKEWANIGDDLKEAWLTPEMIQRLDRAVAKATEEIADPALVGKRIFGKDWDEEIGGEVGPAGKLGKILSEKDIYKKSMAELEFLDELFGSEYTQEAIAAYKAKQLQLKPDGKTPLVNNIRTGKFLAGLTTGMTTGGGVGGTIGGAVGGPIGVAAGSALGSPVGGLTGVIAQSPAGALAIFRTLNWLETSAANTSAREVAKKTTSQAIRSAMYGRDDK